jgi:predicted nucleic acid-binding protein
VTGDLHERGLSAARRALLDTEKTLTVHQLTDAVLEIAAMPLASAIRTLDAIHVATAFLLRETRREEVTFVTYDRRQAQAASLLEFPILGVGV